MGTLINRILGKYLLISSLSGSALRMHVALLGKPHDSTSILKALPGKLDIKRYSPSILYVSVLMKLLPIAAFDTTSSISCRERLLAAAS